MAASFVYDITRLVTRMLNKTPNGIDRVDFAYANHFLAAGNDGNAGVMTTLLGPRLFSRTASLAAVEGIGVHWGEADDPQEDAAYRKIVAALGERPSGIASQGARIERRRSGQAAGTWRWMRTHGAPTGQSLVRHVPENACYLNVSQFPLWISRYFRWLEQRPDVKAVFFLHDLLPIERPEFFPPAEEPRYHARLANVAHYGHAVITSSQVCKEGFQRALAERGRPTIPILALPLPVSPIFHERAAVPFELEKEVYFICCGTIEPRKNHLLLLHLWRQLAEKLGPVTPKLVLIGNRGWENENAVDLLERCPVLQGHVIEASGLSTPALKRLLDGARALLMPSFAEGYGLPVAEALAAGVPVIASDIPVFREIGGETGSEAITYLPPLAGDRWLEAILNASENQRHVPQLATPGKRTPPWNWTSYFRALDDFLADL